MNDAIRRMLDRYQPMTSVAAERALREILQEITLVGLWRGKFFEHAAFYGGTALRILYGLDRFSEDLDFTLNDSQKDFSWHSFERHVVDELTSYGFEVSFLEKSKTTETAVKSAFLKTNTQHALLQIGIGDIFKLGIHPNAMIRIKVEIDSSPILGYDVEQVFLRDPLPISINVLKESSLFAGKVNAALYRAWKNRVKGRDWYDLIWFLRKNIPLNAHYLEKSMRYMNELARDEFLTEKKLQTMLMERLEKISLEEVKKDVRPFLRDPAHLDVWSTDFFQHWISKLHFEAKA